MKSVVATKSAPSAIGPYSQAVRHGSTLFISGQIGKDPATGEFASDDVYGQTVQCLKNMQAILQEAGMSIENVVKTTVFITYMANFRIVNKAYAEVFTERQPARSCVAVYQLPAGALVEIEAIAME